MPKTIAGRRPILRAAVAALAALPVAACERMLTEMRTPPNQTALPTIVMPPGPNQTEQIAQVLADSFAGQGLRLAGRPDQMARAVALLEYAYNATGNDPGFARQMRAIVIANNIRTSLRIARDEVRQSIGIRPEAPYSGVIAAMAGVMQATRDSNRQIAIAVLSPALFLPGGVTTYLRLGRPGPMPAAEQATAQMLAEVQRLNATGGWYGAPIGEAGRTGGGFTSSVVPTLGVQY